MSDEKNEEEELFDFIFCSHDFDPGCENCMITARNMARVLEGADLEALGFNNSEN